MTELKRWVSWSVAFVLLGCGVQAAVTPLSPAGTRVEIAKADPPGGAVLVAPIQVEHGSGCGMYGRKGTLAGAMNEMREEAARRGADYVEILTVIEPHSEHGCFDQTFKITGMAYKLGSSPPAKVADNKVPEQDRDKGTAATSEGCNPPCSPGFACHAGVCEPQCNPTCDPGQKCNKARTCVAADSGT